MATLYVIVEGERTERRLYRSWLPYLLPDHRQVERIEDAAANTFFIVAGFGYPSYKQRIVDAIADVSAQESPFSHLVVAVDSEERARVDVEAEVQAVINDAHCPLPSRTLVAECCIETWLLGNRKVVSRSPESAELRGLLGLYSVVSQDPERMPNLDARFTTRAQFHGHYLRHVFAERRIPFSKKGPGAACGEAYFEQLRLRTESMTDGRPDLASFANLLGLPGWIEATAPR